MDLDEFPDSPYVRELRRGVSSAPFPSEIEAEYQRSHLERVHWRVRLWYSMSLAIGVVLTLVHVESFPRRTIADAALACWLIVPALALCLIVWTRWYDRLFPKSHWLIGTMYCGTIVNIAMNLPLRAEAATGLLIDVFTVHFLAGISFRSAVLVDAAMLMVFLLASAALHIPTFLLAYGALVLAITAAVTAFVHQDIQRSYRRGFLERAVILQMASKDGLTGLVNRRGLDEHLRRIWKQALRDHRTIGLALIDIDHFKRFNDQWGHQAGDDVLRAVARVIAGSAQRPLDLAARYGGEEFAVILFDVQPSLMLTLCEHMRERVERLHTSGSDPCRPVTISIGAGLVAPTLDRSIQGAIQFADEALYAAKEAGRNRVVIRGVEEYRSARTGIFNPSLAG